MAKGIYSNLKEYFLPSGEKVPVTSKEDPSVSYYQDYTPKPGTPENFVPCRIYYKQASNDQRPVIVYGEAFYDEAKQRPLYRLFYTEQGQKLITNKFYTNGNLEHSQELDVKTDEGISCFAYSEDGKINYIHKITDDYIATLNFHYHKPGVAECTYHYQTSNETQHVFKFYIAPPSSITRPGKMELEYSRFQRKLKGGKWENDQRSAHGTTFPHEFGGKLTTDEGSSKGPRQVIYDSTNAASILENLFGRDKVQSLLLGKEIIVHPTHDDMPSAKSSCTDGLHGATHVFFFDIDTQTTSKIYYREGEENQLYCDYMKPDNPEHVFKRVYFDINKKVVAEIYFDAQGKIKERSIMHRGTTIEKSNIQSEYAADQSEKHVYKTSENITQLHLSGARPPGLTLTTSPKSDKKDKLVTKYVFSYDEKEPDPKKKWRVTYEKRGTKNGQSNVLLKTGEGYASYFGDVLNTGDGRNVLTTELIGNIVAVNTLPVRELMTEALGFDFVQEVVIQGKALDQIQQDYVPQAFKDRLNPPVKVEATTSTQPAKREDETLNEKIEPHDRGTVKSWDVRKWKNKNKVYEHYEVISSPEGAKISETTTWYQLIPEKGEKGKETRSTQTHYWPDGTTVKEKSGRQVQSHTDSGEPKSYDEYQNLFDEKGGKIQERRQSIGVDATGTAQALKTEILEYHTDGKTPRKKTESGIAAPDQAAYLDSHPDLDSEGAELRKRTYYKDGQPYYAEHFNDYGVFQKAEIATRTKKGETWNPSPRINQDTRVEGRTIYYKDKSVPPKDTNIIEMKSWSFVNAEQEVSHTQNFTVTGELKNERVSTYKITDGKRDTYPYKTLLIHSQNNGKTIKRIEELGDMPPDQDEHQEANPDKEFEPGLKKITYFKDNKPHYIERFDAYGAYERAWLASERGWDQVENRLDNKEIAKFQQAASQVR